MQVPKFGALLMYPTGGGIDHQPYGLVLTDDNDRYALDDVVIANGEAVFNPDSYYGDVLVGKSDEVATLASRIEDTTPKQAAGVKNKMIETIRAMVEARHMDAAGDLRAQHRPEDYKAQTAMQDNPDNFDKVKAAILDGLKDAAPALVTKNTGAHQIVVDPFGESDLIF